MKMLKIKNIKNIVNIVKSENSHVQRKCKNVKYYIVKIDSK